jgi:hypothetical protein
MRIDSSGNVGIGTTSPNWKLHVATNAGFIAEFQNTAGANYRPVKWTDNSGATVGALGADFTADEFILQAVSKPLIFGTGTNGAERARIDTSGNVGIGTTSPDQKFHVEFANTDTSFSGGSGGAWGSDGIRIENTSSTTNTMAMLHLRNNDADIHIASIRQGTDDSDLGFFFEGSEKVRITSDGNVGIGTTNPTTKLHLSGDSVNLSLDGTGAAGTPITSISLSRGSVDWGIHSGIGGGNLFGIKDNQNSAYRLAIDTSGNVGIGTTSPSAKLQVEEYGIDTTETSTTATTQVAIHTMSATTFRSARFTVQVTNSTDSTYHLTEILMIHDGTTPSITEYGTIFTGSAEATFDADISSGNVRLLATPASTDTMEFKVVAHSITT